MSPALAAIFTELEKAIAELTPQEAPAVIGELERIKTIAWTKIMSPSARQNGQPEASVEGERLLTAEAVAELLNVPKAYVYDLARRNEIPTVRFGKYVRVPTSALREWVARHQDKVLDKALYETYSSSKGHDDRLRTPANPKAAWPHPGSPSRTGRSHPHHRGAVGTRRDADSRTDGPVDPPPGKDRTEKEG